MNKPTKELQLSFLKTKITTDPRWTERALLKIFEAQTASEQVTESTNHHNGVGFTGSDAPFLTSCAKRVLFKGHLTEKQLPWVFKKMGKYARQLMHCPSFREEKLIAIMEKELAE